MSLLVLMSGLPGVGKSAIADALGERLPAVVVSVDEIEAAMLRSGIDRPFETGLAAYNAGAAIAEHQLRLGLSVIADAANYLEVGCRSGVPRPKVPGATSRSSRWCAATSVRTARDSRAVAVASSRSPSRRGPTSSDGVRRPSRGRGIG
jgi:AAA domain